MTIHNSPAADVDRGIRECLDVMEKALAKLRVLYSEKGVPVLLVCDLLDVETIVRVARKRLEEGTT